MSLFRKKLPLDDAMRLMLGATVRRDPRETLADVAAAGVLPPDRLDAVAKTLPAFEVCVWHQLWAYYAALRVAPEELLDRFMNALELALRDSGASEDQVARRLEHVRGYIAGYLRFLEGNPAGGEAQDHPFTRPCEHFTGLVMPGADVEDEGTQRQRRQVFEIAKGSWLAAAGAFTSLVKQYKVTVS